MISRAGVVVLSVTVLAFIAVLLMYAIGFLLSGYPILIGLGIALILPALAGLWALWNEVAFGVRADRLGRRLEEEGGLPSERVQILPSGRVRRSNADAVFPKYRAEVEADPGSWQPRFRLGLVYEGAGDRRRARAAIRDAIRLERQERRSHGRFALDT